MHEQGKQTDAGRPSFRSAILLRAAAVAAYLNDTMKRIRAPVSGCSEAVDPIKALWSFKAFLPDAARTADRER